jgi:GNAT superfamily N-acetyltransferase
MIHADHTLARRLEGLICAEYRRLAEVARDVFPGAEAECVAVADGLALWLGEGSPVNGAVGLGMRGPVEEADVVRLEAFYRERGATAVTNICPLADSSLLLALGRRGWRATGFEHLLVLALDSEPPKDVACRQTGDASRWSVAAPEVRVCSPEERETWVRIATLGFSDEASPGRGEEEFGRIMAGRDEAILVLAWVDGEPAGTGALVIDGGVGWLLGDSTVPEYRRRGVQQAIQRHRLELAREAGCHLAVTEAAPGGASQRNMERLGFSIAYTHVEFESPWHDKT